MKDYFNSISCTIIIVWLSRVEKTYISQGQKFHYDLDKRYDETVGVERWDCTLLVNGQFRSKYCWVADAGKISSVSIYAYYDLEKECERLRGMGYFGDIQELKINNIFVDYREHYPCISIYFDKEAQPSFHCSD